MSCNVGETAEAPPKTETIRDVIEVDEPELPLSGNCTSNNFDVAPVADLVLNGVETPQTSSMESFGVDHVNGGGNTVENELMGRCALLETSLAQKDTLIDLLQKEKILFEKERKLNKKEVETSRREKETAVMRYATVEMSLIEIKTAKEKSDQKCAQSLKETDLLSTRLRTINTEKSRICSLLDTKCIELRNTQKEVEKLKSDLSAIETKSKWTTAKLKQELDLKAAAEKRVEELSQEVSVLQETSKFYEPGKQDKFNALEKQTIEQQAQLIMFKHGNEEKERAIGDLEYKLQSAESEMIDLSKRFTHIANENKHFAEQVSEQLNEINELQSIIDREVMKVAELQSKLSDFETIKTQLTIEKEVNNQLRTSYSAIKTAHDELELEQNNLRARETELLLFNQEITEQSVKLQTSISMNQSKVIAMQLERDTMKREHDTAVNKFHELQLRFDAEQTKSTDDKLLMAQHISEKTRQAENLQKLVEHTLGDLDALKKKHSQTVKELNREISQLTKKLGQKVDEERELTPQSEPPSPQNSDTDSQSGNGSNVGNSNEMPTIQIKEPSKKQLIERIVRLQQSCARQSEKIDFLENQSATLLKELQKKSKLIQYYMVRDQAGALASSKSDRNKAELSKYGGIMSAIYGGVRGNVTTDMTLDLSLEINRKLQAVLEDTLLKNITLKENLDTLGLEVDTLTRKLSSK